MQSINNGFQENASSKILLATGDSEWGPEMRVKLSSFGFSCQLVREGKEAQLTIYKEKYSVVLLDPDIKNHSGMEVLKFLKLNYPAVRVVLIFPDKKRSEDYKDLQSNLNRIGVSRSFVRPVNPKVIADYLNDVAPAQNWKHTTFRDSAEIEEHDQSIKDKDCTRADINSFLSGNIAIFDHYIRIKENHFVKIVRRGENLDPQRIRKYMQDGVKYLYFLTRERRNYINYMNELTRSTLMKENSDKKAILSQLKNVSEKFMEEVYTRGLKPDLIEESKLMSENTHNLIRRNDVLKGLMAELETSYPEKYSHSFLVSFFATIIAKNLPWVGPRTLESVSLAASLHDIGTLKLPAHLREKDPAQMKGTEYEIYKTHCRLGAEMLGSVQDINPQVVQIIFQHHERANGAGYPLGLTAIRIYPLAKIVALADEFSDLLVTQKVSPLEGIKLFLKDRERLMAFDPVTIKALASGFIRED